MKRLKLYVDSSPPGIFPHFKPWVPDTYILHANMLQLTLYLKNNYYYLLLPML